MEAIVGVWLTSIVGAGAFSAAGYVLGQRGVVVPWLRLPAPAGGRGASMPAASSVMAPAAPAAADETPPPAIATTPPPPAAAEHDAPAEGSAGAPSGRTTLVPPGSDPRVPVPRASSLAPGALAEANAAAAAAAVELESLRADVQAALSRAEAAAQKAKTAEVSRSELERQIETLKKELRIETVARSEADTRALELGDRLAKASEESATLRHKVTTLDKQVKQLREALQGRVRALTASEWHRRRELEDAEEIRQRLREVSDKLERSSSPPSPGMLTPGAEEDLLVPRDVPGRGVPEFSSRPSFTSASAPPGRSLRPSIDEAAALREEVSRLTAENRSLRARAIASVAPRKPGGQAGRRDPSDPNLDGYRGLLDRIGAVAGLRGAVVGDEVGSVLVGAGELADGLAAFGAYILDASARTNGLLPLEEIEEVDLRDRGGMLLSTVVLAEPPSDLCLVLLGASSASMIAAKKVVKETLRGPMSRRS